MENAVIDTSVAVKWFFEERGYKKAIELKEKQLKREIVIYTRDLFLYEFTSVFKNYSTKKIEEKDFSLAVAALFSLNIKFLTLKNNELEELYALAKQTNLSVYDCSYLLLAKNLKSPLYTSDKKLYLKSKDLIKVFLV